MSTRCAMFAAERSPFPVRRATLTAALLALALLAAACVPPPVPPAGSAPLPPAPGGAYGASVHVGGAVFDSPDPSVVAAPVTECDDGDSVTPLPSVCYFAYTTGSTDRWLSIFPILRSTDPALTEWEHLGNALAFEPAWAETVGYGWGPSIDHVGETWVLYYSARARTSGRHCIGRATSTRASGPFVDASGAPMLCDDAQGGAIDPQPVTDEVGGRWLAYKTEGIDHQTAGLPTRIWSVRLTADGLTTSGGPALLLEVQRSPSPEWPIVEGPTLVHVPEGWFLLYSANRWQGAGYAVWAATCEAPAGPCRRTYATPLVGNRASMVGPGGQHAFVAADGRWRLAFHAWELPAAGYPVGRRSMRILPLDFTGGRPRVG